MSRTDTKRIICLANSRTLTGRSIAGREWIGGRLPGTWVRPVSERECGDVSEYERQYEDGAEPGVLDIIDIPVLEPRPKDWHRENWLLDSELYWRKKGSYSWFDLPALLDPVAPLWLDGYRTYDGRNDRIPDDSLQSVTSSLRLIHVERIELAVFRPGEAFGNQKRRVQGRFSHAGNDYALWVTDPEYEREYLAKLDGAYQIGECYLTISLGEPCRGSSHKLIAAIIECNRPT